MCEIASSTPGALKDASQPPRCECQEEGSPSSEFRSWYSDAEWAVAFHAPGECKSTINLQQYERAGKLVWLCSTCC